MLRLLQAAGEHLSVFTRRPSGAQRNLERSLHGGKWRAKLVSDIRDDAALCIQRAFEPLEHRVEDSDQPVKLLRIGMGRNTFAGCGRIDGFSMPCDFAHGGNRRPRQPTGPDCRRSGGQNDRYRSEVEKLLPRAPQRLC